MRKGKVKKMNAISELFSSLMLKKIGIYETVDTAVLHSAKKLGVNYYLWVKAFIANNPEQDRDIVIDTANKRIIELASVLDDGPALYLVLSSLYIDEISKLYYKKLGLEKLFAKTIAAPPIAA